MIQIRRVTSEIRWSFPQARRLYVGFRVDPGGCLHGGPKSCNSSQDQVHDASLAETAIRAWAHLRVFSPGATRGVIAGATSVNNSSRNNVAVFRIGYRNTFRWQTPRSRNPSGEFTAVMRELLGCFLRQRKSAKPSSTVEAFRYPVLPPSA